MGVPIFDMDHRRLTKPQLISATDNAIQIAKYRKDGTGSASIKHLIFPMDLSRPRGDRPPKLEPEPPPIVQAPPPTRSGFASPGSGPGGNVRSLSPESRLISGVSGASLKLSTGKGRRAMAKTLRGGSTGSTASGGQTVTVTAPTHK